MKEYYEDEYTIRVGENARENWDLIDKSKQSDIWIHLDDFSSPHVVIERIKKPVPKSIIKIGCIYCKNHSKYTSMKNISIMYTEIKFVKKAETVGSVNVKKYSTMKI